MIDASIIAHAVKYKSLVELQQAGVSADDFVDEWRTAWRFLVRSWRDHDTTPSSDTFSTRFPDLDLPHVRRSELAMLVAQLRQRRKFMDFMRALNDAATSEIDFETVDDAIQVLQGKLSELAYRQQGRSHLVDLLSRETTDRMVEHLQELRSGRVMGIPTGLDRFDRTVGGLMKPRMVTVMARTGMGKCLGGDSEVLMPDGTLMSIAQWRGRATVAWVDGRLDWVGVAQRLDQGVQETHEVVTASGRRVVCTAEHPLLTPEGWRPLSELRVGSHVAVARRVPGPVALTQPELRESWMRILGHLIADGTIAAFRGHSLVVAAQHQHIAERLRADFDDAGWSSAEPAWDEERRQWAVEVPDAEGRLRSVLLQLGVGGASYRDKAVQGCVLACHNPTLAHFLGALWDAEGECVVGPRGAVTMRYVTMNERVARRVQHIAARFGINLRLRTVGQGWELATSDPADLVTFLDDIPLRSEAMLRRLVNAVKDLAPQEAPDVEMEPITSIRALGQRPTYDLGVPGPHNFVANGLVVHNSWLDLLFMANAVKAGQRAILYPLEMSLFETATRLYTIFSHEMFGVDRVIRNHDLNRGKVSIRKVVKFLHFLEDKFEGQLYVADVAALSDFYTTERIEAEVELHRPDLFWVDYLTLLKAPPGAREEGGPAQVRQLSNAIKAIASRRNCVGGCSAQVNREAIKAGVFLPRLEHIMYGDSIGQDSDLVFSLNRKGRYLYWALVKHRGGFEIGRTKALFDPDRGHFAEVRDEDAEDDEGDPE